MSKPGSGWKLLDGMKFREVTYVPITEPPNITAAAYLATLAYPDDLDDRDKFIEAAKAYGVYLARKAGRLDFKARMRPRDIVPKSLPKSVARTPKVEPFDLLTEIGERAGLPNVTPHSLRHACGYELAMKGIDTRRLQVYLGHRSISSTTIYTDLAEHATDSVWAA